MYSIHMMYYVIDSISIYEVACYLVYHLWEEGRMIPSAQTPFSSTCLVSICPRPGSRCWGYSSVCESKTCVLTELRTPWGETDRINQSKINKWGVFREGQVACRKYSQAIGERVKTDRQDTMGTQHHSCTHLPSNPFSGPHTNQT